MTISQSGWFVMNDLIHNSVPVLKRLMRVVFIVSLGLATVIVVGIAISSWEGLSTANILTAYVGVALLVVVLLLEVVRRTVNYVFLGRGFFQDRPDLILKIFLAVPVFLLLGAAVMTPFSFSARVQEQQALLEELKVKYDAARAALPGAEDKLKQCQQVAITEQQRQCTLTRDKVEADYNFCMSLDLINTHATCIYDHDYTKYDCTKNFLPYGKCGLEDLAVFNYKTTISTYEALSQ